MSFFLDESMIPENGVTTESVSLVDIMDDAMAMQESIFENEKAYNNMLMEGMLLEANGESGFSRFISKIKEWIKKAWTSLKNFIKNSFNKIRIALNNSESRWKRASSKGLIVKEPVEVKNAPEAAAFAAYTTKLKKAVGASSAEEVEAVLKEKRPEKQTTAKYNPAKTLQYLITESKKNLVGMKTAAKQENAELKTMERDLKTLEKMSKISNRSVETSEHDQYDNDIKEARNKVTEGKRLASAKQSLLVTMYGLTAQSLSIANRVISASIRQAKKGKNAESNENTQKKENVKESLDSLFSL